MGIVSINNIIDGICKAINNEFGDEYEIYTELVEQGLQPPCFAVACTSSDIKQRLGNRYKRNNSFSIYHFPEENIDKRIPSQEVKERLFNALEYITVDGDLTRGTNMNGNIIGNVLEFNVDYNMEVFKVDTSENENKMATLDVTLTAD